VTLPAGLRLPQNADDLLGRMMCLLHDGFPFVTRKPSHPQWPGSEGPNQSFHWSQILTAMLVCIPTSLVLLLAVQLSKNAKSKSESPPTSTVKAAVSKPLPDKIIPKPELSPAVSTPPPIATVEPQKVFETESQDTNSVEAALAQLKDEKQLRIRNMEDMALASWTNNLATYRYALKSLYDIMKSEATRRNDSITLTTDYLNSLPPTIDHSNKEIEVAVIKFTNQTNMDFHIVITGEFRSGEYIMQKRGLRISCGCGNLRFESMGPGNLSLSLQIPDGDSPSPWNVDHELISKKLKILVAAQIEYLKTKSH
jgi:hypothetical protein